MYTSKTSPDGIPMKDKYLFIQSLLVYSMSIS
jgi:hypothetical protein